MSDFSHRFSPTGTPDRTHAAALQLVRAPATDPVERIERLVDVAREVLRMDMGYVCDTRAGLQAYKVVTGDGDSFDARPGQARPLEGTYCQAMLLGQIGNVLRDTSREPVVSELSITEHGRIGSYIGVPIVLSDGQLFGTFCCLSHAPTPALTERDVELMQLLAGLVADQIEYERLRAAAHANELLDGAVGALIASLEVRDGYTERHSQSVVDLAVAIGTGLLREDELDDLRLIAVLHDIGKLGVPDSVLQKPGPLNEDEWEVMRRHPAVGADLIARMRPIAHLAPAIRAEHERWDGQGYPSGLAGEEIPVAARIVLIADAYHAMTSDRPYRRAMSREAACAELVRHSGTQFWPVGVTSALRALHAEMAQRAPSV